MSTHNLCLRAKNIKNIPGQLTPVLLYNNKTHIKVGYKGVYIT